MDDFSADLLDRKSFLQRVDEILTTSTESRRSLAMLYLDLEGVESVNAIHGRHAGDELLKLSCLQIARAVGAQGLVSQLRGDKFACLLVNPSYRARIETFARHLLNAVSITCQIDALDFAITPSIGIVFSPPVGADANTILRWAEGAMRRAKHEHRSYAFYHHRTRVAFKSRVLSLIQLYRTPVSERK